MEIAVWAFIIITLMVVFKALRFEKNNFIYSDKKLLKRYMEIKQLPQDCRVIQIKQWEISVSSALANKNVKSSSKVVRLYTSK
ncbi:MAG: hypothetical protein HRT53_21000 [Colwellia sp.]|nr:hypothetical protein [Colwellia sp.]